MPYEPRLPDSTQQQLREWVLGRFENEASQLEAVRKLEVLFQRVAANPTDMGTESPGPIPGRKCVQRVEVDGVGYPVSVTYEILDEDQAVIITGFSTQPL